MAEVETRILIRYTPHMPKKSPSIDDKLSTIIDELHKINKRERWRMIGGFFRGIISLLPIVIMLIGVWYAYEYSDQILEKVAGAAARQAAAVTQYNPSNMVDTSSIQDLLKQYLP